MFDYIKGILTDKTEKQKTCYFTVENNGIGYKIEVNQLDFNRKSIDDEVKIFVVLIHKEDSMSLCGFLNKESRDIFSILTTVSGVGTKMALGLLNEFEISDLIYFVINENSKELTRAKGVGAKLAQKIILELKDKLINISPAQTQSHEAGMPAGAEDIQNILLSLGYEETEINHAIKSVFDKGITPDNNEEFLRTALQLLSA